MCEARRLHSVGGQDGWDQKRQYVSHAPSTFPPRLQSAGRTAVVWQSRGQTEGDARRFDPRAQSGGWDGAQTRNQFLHQLPTMAFVMVCSSARKKNPHTHDPQGRTGGNGWGLPPREEGGGRLTPSKTPQGEKSGAPTSNETPGRNSGKMAQRKTRGRALSEDPTLRPSIPAGCWAD